jgi:chaperonin GroES
MKPKEKTSSTSSQEETPKVKLALEEKYKEENIKQEKKEEDAYERLKKKESSKLPKPTGWRMIVLPFKMKEKSKGGIYFGQETLEKQQVASTCGLVLAQGPYCYDKEKFPEGPWCKTGDWVVFARYAGSRINIDGGEVRILNDDEVLATITNPEDIVHQY